MSCAASSRSSRTRWTRSKATSDRCTAAPGAGARSCPRSPWCWPRSSRSRRSLCSGTTTQGRSRSRVADPRRFRLLRCLASTSSSFPRHPKCRPCSTLRHSLPGTPARRATCAGRPRCWLRPGPPSARWRRPTASASRHEPQVPISRSPSPGCSRHARPCTTSPIEFGFDAEVFLKIGAPKATADAVRTRLESDPGIVRFNSSARPTPTRSSRRSSPTSPLS